MSAPQGHTLPKEERLCGKTTVSALISDGKWGATAHLRYCWAAGRDSVCHTTRLNCRKSTLCFSFLKTFGTRVP